MSKLNTRRGFITKTQVGNVSKLCYDIGKLFVGGGIITPYLTNADGFSLTINSFLLAALFILVAFILDGIYDRIA